MSTLRSRYEGSLAHAFVEKVGALDFGSWILIFGANLMPSVLPIIILLSAFANVHVQDDIARHLGLSREGTGIIEGLFRSQGVTFNVAVLLSLILSFTGTIGVAGSIQVLNEKALNRAHQAGSHSVLRGAAWALCLGVFLIIDGAIGRSLRDEPSGIVVLAVAEFVGLALFFSWTMHFMLGGLQPWRSLWRPAIATCACWIGLGVFSSFYFSSTIVSDSKLYGPIGGVFSLLMWFVAVGAVIALGAAVGALWRERSVGTTDRWRGTRRLAAAFLRQEESSWALSLVHEERLAGPADPTGWIEDRRLRLSIAFRGDA
jgi:membrane protein